MTARTILQNRIYKTYVGVVENKRQPGDSPRKNKTIQTCYLMAVANRRQSGVSTQTSPRTRRTCYQIHFYGCRNNNRASEKNVSTVITMYVVYYFCYIKRHMIKNVCHRLYITNSIFRHSRLSDILSCDKHYRINGFWIYIYMFESRRGHIWRLFRLSLRFITFVGRSIHLAYVVHKSGRKTSIIIHGLIGSTVSHRSIALGFKPRPSYV